MEIFVHPMVKSMIEMFYEEYSQYQVADKDNLFEEIENRLELLHCSETWNRGINFEKPPQDQDDEKYLLTAKLSLKRRGGTIKGKQNIIIDAEIAIGNLIAYEENCLMINDTIMPKSTQIDLIQRVEAHRQDKRLPPVLMSDLATISPTGKRLPEIPVTDTQTGLYGEYIGFYVDSGWKKWDKVRTEIFGIQPET